MKTVKEMATQGHPHLPKTNGEVQQAQDHPGLGQ